MIVKIVNKSTNPLPGYNTELSAGMDLRAFLTDDIVLKPIQRVLVPTRLFIEMPEGFEAQIRPRMGMALKYGISVFNIPRTINADYRGEIGVIHLNLSYDDFEINKGEGICQMIISRHEKAIWNNVEIFEKTVRDVGGFGHIGKK
jgi:dUTP pyrophosphatase